jgi:hypothetical protein
MKSVAILAALAALTGCAHPMGDHYHIVVSPRFSLQIQDEILRTAGPSWAAASKSISFDYVVSDCDEHTFPGEICYMPATQHEVAEMCSTSPTSVGCTIRDESTDSAYTKLSDTAANGHRLTSDERMRIEQHELGHALGLEHTGAGTIMCATTDCEPDSVTCQDVEQFWSVRGSQWPGKLCTL